MSCPLCLERPDAERNAQAHVDSIAGCYQLYNASRSSIDWDVVGTEGRDILPELLWNDGDGSMALQDAVREYCVEQPLDVTDHGTRNRHDNTWSVDSVVILLTVGGPTLYLRCDEDGLDPQMHYSQQGMADQTLPLTDLEREALEWFPFRR